jgi:hypothetical protein
MKSRKITLETLNIWQRVIILVFKVGGKEEHPITT